MNLYQHYFNYYNNFFDQILSSRNAFKLHDCILTIDEKDILEGGCGHCGAKYNDFYFTGWVIPNDGENSDSCLREIRRGVHGGTPPGVPGCVPYEAYTKSYYLGCRRWSDDHDDEDTNYSSITIQVMKLLEDGSSEISPDLPFNVFLPKNLEMINI